MQCLNDVRSGAFFLLTIGSSQERKTYKQLSLEQFFMKTIFLFVYLDKIVSKYLTVRPNLHLPDGNKNMKQKQHKILYYCT